MICPVEQFEYQLLTFLKCKVSFSHFLNHSLLTYICQNGQHSKHNLLTDVIGLAYMVSRETYSVVCGRVEGFPIVLLNPVNVL